VKVTVPLFGVGPGEYLDWATLSLQVPRPGTGSWATPTSAIGTLRTPTIAIERAVFQLVKPIGDSSLTTLTT
jgi:hypothetical protein